MGYFHDIMIEFSPSYLLLVFCPTVIRVNYVIMLFDISSDIYYGERRTTSNSQTQHPVRLWMFLMQHF